MKTTLLIFLYTGVWSYAAEVSVAGRGPHHTTWQRVTEYVTPYGKRYYATNSYQEIGTGQNWLRGGEWVPSVPEITILPTGSGVATQLQHKVIFAPNINTAGAIDCLMPDDKRLRSHVLGLAYMDRRTGQGVMIASIKDSTGVLIANNQVLYTDAFDTEGGFRADIRYTVTLAGLEQDIIVVENPPSPTTYGIDPSNCRLEIYSEFVDFPAPAKETVVLKTEADAKARQAMAEPDLVEEKLSFGVMRMDQGFGFRLGENDNSIPMAKTWEVREQRQLLIERADYSDLQGELARLPKVAQVRDPKKPVPLKVGRGVPIEPQWASFLPARPPKAHAAIGKLRTKEMAQLTLPRDGLVLDWQLLSAQTNQVFRGDETYFVPGQVILSGTTVIEAGAVIKCTNGTASRRVWIKGPVDCRTSPYRPAIFTAQDDDTIGEQISGSTGNPTTNYYGYMVDLTANTNVSDLHDIRIRNAYYGINLGSGSGELTLRHAQIGQCYAAVVSGPSRFRNVLIHDCQYGTAAGATFRCENVTFHRLNNFRSSGTVYATNCLMIAVSNSLVFSGEYNQTNINDSGIFQTAGYGARYLANGSPYRNTGTTNVDSTLLADLRQMTTYPPLVLTNDITIDTTLMPQAQRDADAIDLGAHYLPIDWIVGGINVTSVTLTVKGGAVIAMDVANTNWGIRLQSGGALISQGDPVNLNRFVRTHTVQECPAGMGASTAPFFADTYPSPASPATLSLWASEVAQIQGDYLFNAVSGRGTFAAVRLRDSQFAGGRSYWSWGVSNQFMSWTNLLIENAKWQVYPYTPIVLHAQNCTFKSGELGVEVVNGSSTSVRDCIFDYTPFTQYGGTLTNDYNGYLTNAARLTPNGANDIVLATNSVDFQTGPLGAFYLPTNSPFIDAGSAKNAALTPFYWYTSFTNQTQEGTSRLNVGKLWMVISNGIPIDADGDGVPYWSDADPNSPGAGLLTITIESPGNGAVME